MVELFGLYRCKYVENKYKIGPWVVINVLALQDLLLKLGGVDSSISEKRIVKRSLVVGKVNKLTHQLNISKSYIDIHLALFGTTLELKLTLMCSKHTRYATRVVIHILVLEKSNIGRPD